jgi:hypothetical protein
MALVPSPTYHVSVTLIDRDKNKSTVSFHVPTAVTVGALADQMDTSLLPAITAVSDAIIESWSISMAANDHSAASLAPESADVERKGVFSFRADNGAVFVCQVPSIRNTLVIDETNIIDRANLNVLQFINAVTDPGLLALGKPATYLGADLVSLDKARKTHRGSSRG